MFVNHVLNNAFKIVLTGLTLRCVWCFGCRFRTKDLLPDVLIPVALTNQACLRRQLLVGVVGNACRCASRTWTWCTTLTGLIDIEVCRGFSNAVEEIIITSIDVIVVGCIVVIVVLKAAIGHIHMGTADLGGLVLVLTKQAFVQSRGCVGQ